MRLAPWISRSVRAMTMGAAMLVPLQASAGHDAVDPAVKRFTGKVTGIGKATKAGRTSTLRFEPIGPGMVAPLRNEMRGWRLTFLRGKLLGRSLWLKSNTPTELTIRDTDPSLEGVVEGDIVIIELIDPNLAGANG